MPWTSVDNLSASAPLPEGYRYQLITRSDIPDTVNAFASWYPGIAVGNASCHLKPGGSTKPSTRRYLSTKTTSSGLVGQP